MLPKLQLHHMFSMICLLSYQITTLIKLLADNYFNISSSFSYQTCYTLKNTIDCLYIVEQVRLVIKLPFFQNLHLLPHTESLIHNVSKATLSRLVAHLKIFLKLSNYNTFKIKLRNY